MTLAAELAALSALARRLSEPWPAERFHAARGFILSRHRLEWRFPHVFDERPRPGRAEDQSAARAVAERVQSPPVRHHRSWMPSIARVGPIVFRWPAETVQPEPEAWRTYEAIRAALSIARDGVRVSTAWAREVPSGELREAFAAVPDRLRDGSDLDAFARAIADRLAPQPVHLPAVVHPRRRRDGIARGRRWRRARWSTGFDRATLGALAARYCARRTDGSYNRHDARRWMRRFRAVAIVAADAIERWGLAGRPAAIHALIEVVGLDDAVRLTERPWPVAPPQYIECIASASTPTPHGTLDESESAEDGRSVVIDHRGEYYRPGR